MQIVSWLQLYLRESDGAPIQELCDFDPALEQSTLFNDWKASKREIRLDEVVDRCWIKSCTAGYITEVYMHADGTLDEYTLFDRLHTNGVWELVEGVLHLTIRKGENTYQMSIVGNRNPAIHSAIEYKNGQVHSYLKLAAISQ